MDQYLYAQRRYNFTNGPKKFLCSKTYGIKINFQYFPDINTRDFKKIDFKQKIYNMSNFYEKNMFLNYEFILCKINLNFSSLHNFNI